ncbi:MAG: sugar phosphate isomerase/epimerase [Chloroflexia bacterium]|nr:sugar phosphate isomerase/epimerase [Chloroflexia bacterium]
MKKDQIGIQLYTLREAAAADMDGTLAKVAEQGYTSVEFAGFNDHTAAQVKAMLNKHGLRAASAHIPLPAFQNRLDGVIEDLVTLGAEWGVVPWVAPDDRSEATMRGYGEQFDSYAEQMKLAGVKFAYHNHDFEFADKTAEGKTLFDTLVSVTTPGLVFFELDAFWAAVGGFDPEQVIKDNADRIALLHLKDGSIGPGSHKDAPFGEGDLKWEPILTAAREAGVSWYITEQDAPSPENPFLDTETSLRNAETMAL